MHSEKGKTPSLANWLASKFIDDSYFEEFFGDLEEIYEERIIAHGKFYAKWMYWIDVMHLLFGFSSIRRFKIQNNNSITITLSEIERTTNYGGDKWLIECWS